METRYTSLFLVAAALLIGGTALAQVPWQVPPPFEVQRDIYWSFDDPAGVPEYYGPDDPALMGSDYVEWGGLTVLAPYFGIENYTGQETMTGVAYFHVDNWDRNNPLKLIWLQADVYEFGSGDVWLEIYDDTGKMIQWNPVLVSQIPGTDIYQETVFAAIRPNPLFEDFVFNYVVPPGGTAWIDNLRIATACVPEPGLISLAGMGLGVLGLAVTRRKK